MSHKVIPSGRVTPRGRVKAGLDPVEVPPITHPTIIPSPDLANYIGDITPYLDGSRDNIAVDVNGRSVVTIPDGIYSIGPLTTIGGKTIIDVDRIGETVIIQAETPGGVLIDGTLNAGTLQFESAPYGHRQRLGLIGVRITGTSVLFNSIQDITGAWCSFTYSAAQWCQNLVTCAKTFAWWDTIKDETPIHKDLPHDAGVLSNYAFKFAVELGKTDGSIDPAACHAKINAASTNAATGAGQLSRGWMDPDLVNGVSAKWRDLLNKMGHWLPTPIRTASSSAGANQRVKLLGCDLRGADDGLFMGAFIDLEIHGCQIQTTTEFVDNNGFSWSIDPGTVTGSENDQMHNDALQLNAGGSNVTITYSTFYGRIILNKAPTTGSAWNVVCDNCRWIAIPHLNAAGLTNVATAQQQVPTYPAGVDNYDPLFLISRFSGQTTDVMSGTFTNQTGVVPDDYSGRLFSVQNAGTGYTDLTFDGVQVGTTGVAAEATVTRTSAGATLAEHIDPDHWHNQIDNGHPWQTWRTTNTYANAHDLIPA